MNTPAYPWRSSRPPTKRAPNMAHFQTVKKSASALGLIAGALALTGAAPASPSAKSTWQAGTTKLAIQPPDFLGAYLDFSDACEGGLVPACFAATDALESIGGSAALRYAADVACAAGNSRACVARDLLDSTPILSTLDAHCDAGIAQACRRAGSDRFDGTTLSRDLGGATTNFQKACDLGSALSCVRLYTLYAEGAGVLRDAAAAAKWGGKGCARLSDNDCRMDTTDTTAPLTKARTIDPGEFSLTGNDERASYCLVAVELDQYGTVRRHSLLDCDALTSRSNADVSRWRFIAPTSGTAPFYATVPLYFGGR